MLALERLDERVDLVALAGPQVRPARGLGDSGHEFWRRHHGCNTIHGEDDQCLVSADGLDLDSLRERGVPRPDEYLAHSIKGIRGLRSAHAEALAEYLPHRNIRD